jgi:hypothetical protein
VTDHILRYPDPLLRRKAEPIEKVTPEIRDRALALFPLMREEDGIGLASSQGNFKCRSSCCTDAKILPPSYGGMLWLTRIRLTSAPIKENMIGGGSKIRGLKASA